MRFGLTDNSCPAHYLYCSRHVIESTEVSISWKKNDGTEQHERVFIDIPREASSTEILTRADHRKCKVVHDVKVSKKRKLQPSNNQNIRKPKINRWCCYVNCCVNSDTPNAHFSRVPRLPKFPPSAESSNNVRLTYATKKFIRLEFLRRIGAATNDTRADIRICNNHQVERLTKQVTYELLNGTQCTTTITFDVPSAFTFKSNMNSNSAVKHRNNKGNAYNRFQRNYLHESSRCAETNQNWDWALVLFQALEEQENGSNNEK